MSNWYPTTHKKITPIYKAIINHSFIQELISGTLSRKIFDYYLVQDAIYLSEYKRILAALASKCQGEDEVKFFLNSSLESIAVEEALHRTFISDKPTAMPSPNCQLYTSFLWKIIATGSLEESVAAVLPCYTIYNDVGKFVTQNQDNQIDNPYQSWIDTYSGTNFSSVVAQAILIADELAATTSVSMQKKMTELFVHSSKMEWLFWDGAYNLEKWKI